VLYVVVRPIRSSRYSSWNVSAAFVPAGRQAGKQAASTMLAVVATYRGTVTGACPAADSDSVKWVNGARKKKTTMATVPSLSSPPCLLHSQVAAHRDRQRCPFRSFHSAQASSNKCHSFRGKQSCTALRCVVAVCLCVCAGRHSWWWPASSGRRPSGRPPVAFGRGRGIDGCRTQQRSGRGKVRGDELSRSTRSTYYCILVRSTRTGYRQAAGPGPNPVCLWIGRTRSLLLIGGHGQTDRPGWVSGRRAWRAIISSSSIRARQARTVVLCLFCHWNSPRRRRQTDGVHSIAEKGKILAATSSFLPILCSAQYLRDLSKQLMPGSPWQPAHVVVTETAGYLSGLRIAVQY